MKSFWLYVESILLFPHLTLYDYIFMSVIGRSKYLFFWIQQVEKLHDRQEVSQGVLLNASWYELQQDPHQVVSSFDETSARELDRTRGA